MGVVRDFSDHLIRRVVELKSQAAAKEAMAGLAPDQYWLRVGRYRAYQEMIGDINDAVKAFEAEDEDDL